MNPTSTAKGPLVIGKVNLENLQKFGEDLNNSRTEAPISETHFMCKPGALRLNSTFTAPASTPMTKEDPNPPEYFLSHVCMSYSLNSLKEFM